MIQAMIDYTQSIKHDHYLTPPCALEPLLHHLSNRWKIWEPTDTYGDSPITKVFKGSGYDVISTAKSGLDFLLDTPNFYFDCIITNPPYSLKDQFIERCIKLGKPWALLMPITALEGVYRGALFSKIELQLCIFDRRLQFTNGQNWFNASWFASGIFPKQLQFWKLNKELVWQD